MSDETTNSFSKLNLNPKASSWTPNTGAKAFVPTFAASPAPAPAPVAAPVPAPAPITQNKPTVVSSSQSDQNKVNEEKPSVKENVVNKSKLPAKAKPSETATKTQTNKAPEPAIVDEDIGDEVTMDMYGKEHINVVFMGHVDAGKSTMGGQILFLTGMVDKRTMEKYEKDAKDAGRESWYLSWALDTNTEERAKGKTVETGRSYFETEKRRYTILDAPGHKSFVPSMIQGASQADIGVLVISARKGEFETGFERGGQTCEHTTLAKTSGVNTLIIAINKMDDPTVNWDKERYDEIVTKLTPFLRQNGFNPKTNVHFMPLSGFSGANIKDRSPDVCPYYKGPSLLEYLDNMKMTDRKLNGPFVMLISETYKDMGTIVAGKIESGHIKKGQQVIVMPSKRETEISAIINESGEEIDQAMCGDNIRFRLKGVEEEEVNSGNVLCTKKRLINGVTRFECQLALLEHRNIITAGYNAVMHAHSASEEVEITRLYTVDKETGRKLKKPLNFLKTGQKTTVEIKISAPICIDTFSNFPQLGRFTLRDEGRTVAIGKITKLLKDE